MARWENVAQADDYLGTLFHPYACAPDLSIEIRCLAPKSRPTDAPAPRRWYPLAAYAKAAAECREWGKAWDVYVGVLPRMGSGKAEHVTTGAWLWTDVDGNGATPADCYQIIRASGLPVPEMVVCSGGGAHAYWRIADPVTLPDAVARAQYKALLRRLAERIGSGENGVHADTCAADVARILRVPETFNHKLSEPRPVTLIHCDDLTPHLSHDAWLRLLPPAPPAVKPIVRSNATGQVTDGLRAWAERGYQQGERHRRLVADAAWLMHDCGIPASDVDWLIRRKAQASRGSDPITEQEIVGILKWA